MRYILLLTVLLTSTTIAAATFDETMAAAKQGNTNAQFNLGLMYSEGFNKLIEFHRSKKHTMNGIV